MNDEWNGKVNDERNDQENDEPNDRGNDKRNDEANGERKMFTYRVLRYVPNLVRDEWVNIGVLLEDGPSGQRAIKLIEEDSEFARVWTAESRDGRFLVARARPEHSTPSFANRTRR